MFPLIFVLCICMWLYKNRGSILCWVIPKTPKMVLDISLLRSLYYNVKGTNPRKGAAPFPTHRCSSYWKGSLWVTFHYSHQLYCICIFVSQNVMSHFLGKIQVFDPTIWYYVNWIITTRKSSKHCVWHMETLDSMVNVRLINLKCLVVTSVLLQRTRSPPKPRLPMRIYHN